MPVMLSEIKEQPDWVERALATERGSAQALARAIRDRDVRFAVIAARGTSDNAATYAKYLIEIVSGMPVALCAPSVYTLYDARPSLSHTLVIGISQSGRGTDVVQVLSAARSAGALTACITNDGTSPITQVSDHVLLCHAGEERAVAATKTYTTALAVVALLAATLADHRELAAGLTTVAETMRACLPVEERVQQIVQRYRYMQECAVLARGVNQATALEAALKLTETCYVVAKPYSGADFLHGPIAMVSDGFPCMLYAPPGRAYPFMLELALTVRHRGAETVVVSSEPEILQLATVPIEVPVSVDELLSPLVYVVAGQLFACHLSRVRGANPDSPRGLTKVTLTR
ncbi:MAG TPA: SIS domain-containing protein [Chthonomonadales bacterium]|nr:SIS domain-containing protein [Chthonomonadales bacterium]